MSDDPAAPGDRGELDLDAVPLVREFRSEDPGRLAIELDVDTQDQV